MADVNSTLVKEVFDVAKGQRKTNVHHDRELDNFARCLEVKKRVLGHAGNASRVGLPVQLACSPDNTSRGAQVTDNAGPSRNNTGLAPLGMPECNLHNHDIEIVTP